MVFNENTNYLIQFKQKLGAGQDISSKILRNNFKTKTGTIATMSLKNE